MNDLEICKRIAEIEGHETLPLSEYQKGDFYIVINDHGEGYNPLIDDALCFQLMVKYKVNIYVHPSGGFHAVVRNSRGVTIAAVLKKSPNKAICLAIIEAN